MTDVKGADREIMSILEKEIKITKTGA